MRLGSSCWLLPPPSLAARIQPHAAGSLRRRPERKKMAARCSIASGTSGSSAASRTFQFLDGFGTLVETGLYKAWFLDQFGVLHDGRKPYPGAISTWAITSGELTHQHLQRRDDPWFATLGRSCIHMTWSDRGAISLDGLGLQVVSSVDDADFILAHGTEAFGLPSGDALPMTLEELEQVLKLGAKRKIPMVVANPDFVTVEARALRVMPGTLGAKFEKLGGDVKWMGKPDKVIYRSAMAMAGVEACDCIAVGDSLHHDIKGANTAGIQSAFITGGIHATELGLNSFGDVADSSAIQALECKYDAHPSYVMPAFTW